MSAFSRFRNAWLAVPFLRGALLFSILVCIAALAILLFGDAVWSWCVGILPHSP
jgi:hypothetical protein